MLQSENMQFCKTALTAGLILLNAYTSAAEEVGHLILFEASRIDKNCFDRNVENYKDTTNVRISRFFENPGTGDYRLWHIIIYPKYIGSQDDQKIRELVKECEIEKEKVQHK